MSAWVHHGDGGQQRSQGVTAFLWCPGLCPGVWPSGFTVGAPDVMVCYGCSEEPGTTAEGMPSAVAPPVGHYLGSLPLNNFCVSLTIMVFTDAKNLASW